MDKDYVPLVQTALWVVLFLFAFLYLQPEVKAIRAALQKRLESGDAVRIGPLELSQLRNDVAEVRGEVRDLSSQVSELFLHTMSPLMYVNLEKLNSASFGRFEKTPGLERELRTLRDLGYISVESVGQIPAEGPELKDYVSVTPVGKRFVELRRQLATD